MKLSTFIKVLLAMFLSIIILLAIVGYIIGSYFFDLALNPTQDKSIIFGANQNKDNKEKQEKSENFLNRIKYEDVYKKSEDGLNLHSYIVENNSKKWAIVIHGYMSEGADMANISENFYNLGYNLLIPDLRGHGKSEGTYIGMGWHDRLDIISWINYINDSYPNVEIVLYGVSMGGATVMMTSGENLPSNVKAIVEDCGYTTVIDEFSYQLKSIFGLPKFPVINLASIVTNIKAGYKLDEASSIKQVAKSKTPILFIHGDQDTFVPSYMINEVYEAANCEKEILIIEGATHAESLNVNPQLYWSTVEKFLNKYIKN